MHIGIGLFIRYALWRVIGLSLLNCTYIWRYRWLKQIVNPGKSFKSDLSIARGQMCRVFNMDILMMAHISRETETSLPWPEFSCIYKYQ